jgi:arylsulfatase A-like enzyme
MPTIKQNATDLTRRQLLQAGAAAGLAAGMPALACAATTAAARPNIIWIMADDLGFADTGITGLRGTTTPNIDRIAHEGLFLRQSYANSAVCSATRTGLITGRYQYRLRCGLDEPIGRNVDVGLPPEHPTLPSMLREQGYRTVLVGKWHLGFEPKFGPQRSGYERFYGIMSGGTDYFRHQQGAFNAASLGPAAGGGTLLDGKQPAGDVGYLTDLLAQRTVQEIEAARRDAKPLFLSLHFTAPHWPWESPEDKAVSDALKTLQHTDGGSIATYHKMIAAMDAAIGRVLATLDAQGMARDTIVIFTSDNGGERFSDTWPFSGQKTELLEGGIRVPFFVRWPARIPAGTRSEQVNISMDWVPTLLAAAGAAPHKDYPSDGMNLLDVVTGKAAPRSRQLYWRYLAGTQAALRDGDYKYLKLGKGEWLFNLAKDERERANLAQVEPERFKAMKAAWQAWDATMLPYPADTSSVMNVTADRY